MNPFKAIAIRLRDQGLAGLLPTKNNISLRDLHPDRIGSEIQPNQSWPRTDGPYEEGYEDPSISRRATATPGIPYPPDLGGPMPIQGVLPVAGLQTFIGGSTLQPMNQPCKGCANEITDNIYCGACERSPADLRDKSLPIIDRFISKENQDYLYNEWKEKVTVKVKEQARQEFLDEMKEEKSIYRKARLGAIVRAANPDMRHKC